VSGSFLKWHAKRPLAKAVAAAAAADLKARRDAARMSKWSSLEGKIESFVERADGKLSDEQVARSYMVDDTVKRPLVERFLRDARRAVVNEFTEAVRKRFNEMKVVPSYTRDDAMKLLHGDERGMLDRLQVKTNALAQNGTYCQEKSTCTSFLVSPVRPFSCSSFTPSGSSTWRCVRRRRKKPVKVCPASRSCSTGPWWRPARWTGASSGRIKTCAPRSAAAAWPLSTSPEDSKQARTGQAGPHTKSAEAAEMLRFPTHTPAGHIHLTGKKPRIVIDFEMVFVWLLIH